MSSYNKNKYLKSKDVYKRQAVWPVTAKGKQCVWRQIPERLQSDWEKGYIKISKNKSGNNQNKFSVQYLPSGVIKKIESGELEVLGHEEGVPTLLFGDNQTVGGQVPTICLLYTSCGCSHSRRSRFTLVCAQFCKYRSCSMPPRAATR